MIVSILCGPDSSTCNADNFSRILQAYGEHVLLDPSLILSKLSASGSLPHKKSPCFLENTAALFPLLGADQEDNEKRATSSGHDAVNELLSELGMLEAQRGKCKSAGQESSRRSGEWEWIIKALRVRAEPTGSAAGFALANFNHKEDALSFYDHIFISERGTHSSVTGVVTVGEGLAVPLWLPCPDLEIEEMHSSLERYSELCRTVQRKTATKSRRDSLFDRYPLLRRSIRTLVCSEMSTFAGAERPSWSHSDSRSNSGVEVRDAQRAHDDYEDSARAYEILHSGEHNTECHNGTHHESTPSQVNRFDLRHPSFVHQLIFYPPDSRVGGVSGLQSHPRSTFTESSWGVSNSNMALLSERRECLKLLPKAIFLSYLDAIWVVPIVEEVMSRWRRRVLSSLESDPTRAGPCLMNQPALSLLAFQVECIASPSSSSSRGSRDQNSQGSTRRFKSVAHPLYSSPSLVGDEVGSPSPRGRSIHTTSCSVESSFRDPPVDSSQAKEEECPATAVSVTFAHPYAALLIYELVLKYLRVYPSRRGGAGHDSGRGLRVAFAPFGDVLRSLNESDAFDIPSAFIKFFSQSLSDNETDRSGNSSSCFLFENGLIQSPGARCSSRREQDKGNVSPSSRRGAGFSNFFASLRSRSPTPPRVSLKGTQVGPYGLTRRIGKGNNAVVMLGELSNPHSDHPEGPLPSLSHDEATVCPSGVTSHYYLPRHVAVKILFDHSSHADAEVSTLRIAQKVPQAPRLFLETNLSVKRLMPWRTFSSRESSSRSRSQTLESDHEVSNSSSVSREALDGVEGCASPQDEDNANECSSFSVDLPLSGGDEELFCSKGLMSESTPYPAAVNGNSFQSEDTGLTASGSHCGAESGDVSFPAHNTKVKVSSPSTYGSTTPALHVGDSHSVEVKAVVMELLGVDLFDLALSDARRSSAPADLRQCQEVSRDGLSNNEKTKMTTTATRARLLDGVSDMRVTSLSDVFVNEVCEVHHGLSSRRPSRAHSPSATPSGSYRGRRLPGGLQYGERLALILAMLDALTRFHLETGMVHGSVKLENFCVPRAIRDISESYAVSLGHRERKRYAEMEGIDFASKVYEQMLRSLVGRRESSSGVVRSVRRMIYLSDVASSSRSPSIKREPTTPTPPSRTCAEPSSLLRILDYGRSRPATRPVREEPFTGWWYSDWAMMGLPLRQIDDIVSMLHASSYLLLAGVALQQASPLTGAAPSHTCKANTNRSLSISSRSGHTRVASESREVSPSPSCESSEGEEMTQVFDQWALFQSTDSHADALQPADRQFVNCRKARLAAISDIRDSLIAGHRRRLNFAPLCRCALLVSHDRREAQEIGKKRGRSPAHETRGMSFEKCEETPRQAVATDNNNTAFFPIFDSFVDVPRQLCKVIGQPSLLSPSLPSDTPKWWAALCEKVHHAVADYTLNMIQREEERMEMPNNSCVDLFYTKHSDTVYGQVVRMIREAVENAFIKQIESDLDTEDTEAAGKHRSARCQ